MDLLDRLRALISLDSHSAVDNTPVIELVKNWFTNYKTEIQEWERKDGVKGKNLIVKVEGKTSDSATVFICHLDTVPVSSKWTTDPFTVVEKDGVLFGLGICDTKGGIVALIDAIFSLKEKPARDIYLVFDGDEETMSTGLLKFLETFTIKHPQCIAIEPSDGKVLIAQRSIVEFTITTHGVSQHSSKATPELNDADNAIHKMAKVMILLEQDAKKLAREIDPLLGTHTQNFGVISGGIAHNVVPDSCTLVMHRRLLPQRDSLREKEYIEKLLRPIDPTVTIEAEGDIHIGFSTPRDSSFVRKVLGITKKQLPQAAIGAFRAWSEAACMSRYGDSLILGPGSINQAHNANEFISKQELFQFRDIFRDIIESIDIK